jgi:hypothetical protein
VGCSLWREDRSVVYTCCWPSPEQSFSGSSPVGLATILYCLRFETSLFVASYDSQGYGGGIRPRLHTGLTWFLSERPLIHRSGILGNVCLLSVHLHGNACRFHGDMLVSKKLHLSFSYPRKRLTPSDGLFPRIAFPRKCVCQLVS